MTVVKFVSVAILQFTVTGCVVSDGEMRVQRITLSVSGSPEATPCRKGGYEVWAKICESPRAKTKEKKMRMKMILSKDNSLVR